MVSGKYRQPKEMMHLGDGKSDFNTVCQSYFQADFENSATQNSILVLEGYLFNTVLGHPFFCVSHQRLNKIANVVTLTFGKVQPMFFLRRAHGRVAMAQEKVTFV